MEVAAFDFVLPAELVAQDPAAERSDARMLVLERDTGRYHDAEFGRLVELLTPGDLLVLNNTRVFPARLLGRRVPSGGAVECLLVREVADANREPDREGDRSGVGAPRADWEALVHPGQKLKPGARMMFEGAASRLHGEILARHFHGRRSVRLWTEDGTPVHEAIDRLGHIPLPPYIAREDRPSDRERYQTVYARHRGSIAAPTAGLHFTSDLLARLAARGVEQTEITLHVGYGTFQPVRAARVEDHVVDPEVFTVSAAAAAALSRARRDRRRIIAVGTTTTRALESLPPPGDDGFSAVSGPTSLCIRPGHEFRVVQGLITNFHLPRSSLLMLVSAFAGRERVLAAYRHAVAARYRFYSYGDAMLIL